METIGTIEVIFPFQVLSRVESRVEHARVASDILEHQPTAWPVPYACAQPYHPGQWQPWTAVSTLLGLISMA